MLSYDFLLNIKIKVWSKNISRCIQIFWIECKYLNIFIPAYKLIINRMTRSKNMMESNNQINLKFW